MLTPLRCGLVNIKVRTTSELSKKKDPHSPYKMSTHLCRRHGHTLSTILIQGTDGENSGN